MASLAKDAHEHGESWLCVHCGTKVSPEGKTVKEFTEACLKHAKSHKVLKALMNR
jgi:hypothetical protein